VLVIRTTGATRFWLTSCLSLPNIAFGEQIEARQSVPGVSIAGDRIPGVTLPVLIARPNFSVPKRSPAGEIRDLYSPNRNYAFGCANGNVVGKSSHFPILFLGEKISNKTGSFPIVLFGIKSG